MRISHQRRAQRGPLRSRRYGWKNWRTAKMNESFSDGARLKLERAKEALTWAGFRLLDISGERTACIWATRDCDVVRAALRVAGFGELPVRYFESGAVPDQYKGSPLEEDDP